MSRNQWPSRRRVELAPDFLRERDERDLARAVERRRKAQAEAPKCACGNNRKPDAERCRACEEGKS